MDCWYNIMNCVEIYLRIFHLNKKIQSAIMVCDRASLVKSHSKNMRSGTILAIPQINLSLSRRKPNYIRVRAPWA